MRGSIGTYVPPLMLAGVALYLWHLHGAVTHFTWSNMIPIGVELGRNKFSGRRSRCIWRAEIYGVPIPRSMFDQVKMRLHTVQMPDRARHPPIGGTYAVRSQYTCDVQSGDVQDKKREKFSPSGYPRYQLRPRSAQIVIASSIGALCVPDLRNALTWCNVSN